MRRHLAVKFLMFNNISTGFLLMKDSVGVCTPSPRTLSTSLDWHQNRALAPWMSVSGATKTRSSASTGSPLPSTSESFSPETVSHMITHGIQQKQWNMATILQLAWDLCKQIFNCWHLQAMKMTTWSGWPTLMTSVTLPTDACWATKRSSCVSRKTLFAGTDVIIRSTLNQRRVCAPWMTSCGKTFVGS